MTASTNRSVDRSASPDGERDSFGDPGAFAAARQRSMPERLELALSWNAVAAELRSGLAEATGSPAPQR